MLLHHLQDRTLSFDITPLVTQGGDHVANHDVEDDKDYGQAMDDVQESIAVRRVGRNPCKPSWLTTNMIVACTLPVVEEATPSTYRKTEINS